MQVHVWEEGGNPASPLPYFPPHKCWASFWDVPVVLLPLAGVNVPGQGWKTKASGHLMFPGSQTKAIMIRAGLGLKSLFAFIRPSSQTHTERVRSVSNLKYLLWSYKGQAAPGCCAEGLGSGDTPGCFRRRWRYSSSRANTWQLQLHTRDLGWAQLWGPPPPKAALWFLPVPALCPAESAVPLLSGDGSCFQRLHWSQLMHES